MGAVQLVRFQLNHFDPANAPMLVISIQNQLYGGIIMVNIDLWESAVMLRRLEEQGKVTEQEAKKILSRIAAETGADLIISL